MVLMMAAVIAFLLSPVFGKSTAKSARSKKEYELAELNRKKNVLLKEIKDIELDFQMSKISEADFESLTGDYRAQAVEVLKDIDALRGRKPKSGTDKVAVVSASADRGTGFCSECGSSLYESAKFCGACGESV